MIARPKNVLLATSLPNDDSVDLSWSASYMVSPKLDGIRCVIGGNNGVAEPLTRKFKWIPNAYARDWLSRFVPVGFDGELLVRGANFHDVSSGIMSRDGTPDFEYHVFDYVHEWDPREMQKSFEYRFARMVDAVAKLPVGVRDRVKVVPHTTVFTRDALMDFEAKCVAENFEGAMIRHRDAPYKEGRSTLREEILLKLKRFETAEATVVGCTEFMHNENEARRDAVGAIVRSSHRANKSGAGKLGALIMKHGQLTSEDLAWIRTNPDPTPSMLAATEYFAIGTGFTDQQRVALWQARHKLLGQLVTYKHQPSGAKDGGKPRFPTFVGIRHTDDT